MTLSRLLEHGAAECISSNPLFQGVELKPGEGGINERGQALLEIEFISKHLPCRKHVNCVYTRSPAHLGIMATLFPYVDFWGFNTPQDDYDPEEAGEQMNVTCIEGDLGQDMARMIKKKRRGKGETVLMIGCQNDSPLRNIVYHKQLEPNMSLLPIQEMTEDYLSGELLLPIYTPISSSLVYLMSPGHACARVYYPEHLRNELAYFQIFTRTMSDYDTQVERMIIRKYMELTGKEDPTKWLPV